MMLANPYIFLSGLGRKSDQEKVLRKGVLKIPIRQKSRSYVPNTPRNLLHIRVATPYLHFSPG